MNVIKELLRNVRHLRASSYALIYIFIIFRCILLDFSFTSFRNRLFYTFWNYVRPIRFCDAKLEKCVPTIRNKSFPLIPINSCPPKSYPNEFDTWNMVELQSNKIKRRCKQIKTNELLNDAWISLYVVITKDHWSRSNFKPNFMKCSWRNYAKLKRPCEKEILLSCFVSTQIKRRKVYALRY